MVSVEAVAGLPAGWPLVVDPITGQVLAYRAVRDAFRRYQAEGTAGYPVKELMSVYRELAPMAGLEPLYDLERRTTEPGT